MYACYYVPYLLEHIQKGKKSQRNNNKQQMNNILSAYSKFHRYCYDIVLIYISHISHIVFIFLSSKQCFHFHICLLFKLCSVSFDRVEKARVYENYTSQYKTRI